MVKYGVFLTSVNVFDNFFSFDFAKKESEKGLEYFDNCIVYNVNNFACDCMYSINGVRYKKIYSLQNRLYYMIQDYKKTGDLSKLLNYCDKKYIFLRVNNKTINNY
jgi:hypothetical protein